MYFIKFIDIPCKDAEDFQFIVKLRLYLFQLKFPCNFILNLRLALILYTTGIRFCSLLKMFINGEILILKFMPNHINAITWPKLN